jgi:hypothetical protein
MNALPKFVVVCLLAIFVGMGATCSSTVAPERVESAAASFDGNDQNSGIVGVAPAGGYYVTDHFRARYNELIAEYGAKFSPRLDRDAGMRASGQPGAGAWLIDRQHMADFLIMNQWRRAGIAPVQR